MPSGRYDHLGTITQDTTPQRIFAGRNLAAAGHDLSTNSMRGIHQFDCLCSGWTSTHKYLVSPAVLSHPLLNHRPDIQPTVAAPTITLTSTMSFFSRLRLPSTAHNTTHHGRSASEDLTSRPTSHQPLNRRQRAVSDPATSRRSSLTLLFRRTFPAGANYGRRSGAYTSGLNVVGLPKLPAWKTKVTRLLDQLTELVHREGGTLQEHLDVDDMYALAEREDIEGELWEAQVADPSAGISNAT